MKLKLLLTAATTLFVALTTGAIMLEAGERSSKTRRVTVEAVVEVETKNATPLTRDEAVESALEWLISRQQENGGWGPGHVAAGKVERVTVGNTCIALQALSKAGNSPTNGKYKTEVEQAVKLVVAEIEESDHDSLFISDVRGSQLQAKLGTYVDTFMAASVLPEFRGKMGDEESDRKLDEAVEKVLSKIEANQADDGSWKNAGWAPALAQGIAAKSVNKAAQYNYAIDETVRVRAEKLSRDNFDRKTRRFSAAGSAGIELYAGSSNLQAMQDSSNTNRRMVPGLKLQLTEADDEETRILIEKKLLNIAQAESDLRAARDAVVGRIADPKFVAGFGNNGGEEFLSYVNIGESLKVEGGIPWREWNSRMIANMTRSQAADGCWKGKHCITGGTFCTATGILVLLMDRETDKPPIDLTATD
ncbi:MAG: hypothetical protein HKN23_15650 [Verrucomicrobiales bacterium]|nr:hypothetical protein [Verrucomicrobiales bacterium]